MPHPPCVGYTIILTSTAAKDLSRLNKADATVVWNKIKDLTTDKSNLDVKKLKGVASRYRLRVGHFRVIYTIAKGTITIYVVAIGQRKEIYRRINNF